MSEFDSEAFSSDADSDAVAEPATSVFSSEDDHDFIDVLTHGESSEEDDDDDDEFAEDEVETFFDETAVESVIDNAEPTVVMMSLPVTGEPRVDDAIARLSDLSSLPVDEHVAVFEDVQRRLHDTLADLSGQ
jgi:hypothetical protein